LQQKLHRDVKLGNMSLKIVPFSIRVSDVQIGEDPKFATGRPFATTQDLAVSVKLLPLLHHEVAVNSVELVDPKIELVRNPQGVWNFASLQGQQAPSNAQPAQSQAPAQKPAAKQQPSKPSPAPGAPANQPAENKPAQAFSLAELKITNGQVAITDQQKHQSRAVYDHIDLGLKGYEPGKPFDISLAAHLPGQGDQYVKFEGTAGPLNDKNSMATHLDGRLKLNQVSLNGVQKFLNSPQLQQYDAIVSGDASVRNNNGDMNSTGNLELNNVRVKGTEIGYPIKADFNVGDDLNSDVIKIAKLNVNLGPTPISLTGEVNTRPTPAQLNVQLKANNASITELAKLAGAFGVAFNPGMQVAGTLNTDIHASGAADKPAVNGNLSAANLVISGKDIPQPVKVPAITLALTPTTVKSNDFTAQSGSTTLNGNLAMTNYTAPNGMVDATIRTNGANVGELINIAKAYGVSAVEGMSGSGSLSLNVRVQGPMKQPDRLVYSGTGALQNATINTPNFTKPLQIKNANLRFAQNSAVLDNLQASLGSSTATGSATVQNFAAPQIQFNLNADKLNITELQQITAGNTKKAELDRFSLIPTANAQAKPSGGSISQLAGKGALGVGTIIFDQLVLSNFKSNLTFSGNPAGNLMRTLNGDINFNTGNGKFQGLDLLHELSAIGKFSQAQSSKGFTNIVKLGGMINIQNGVANTNNLQAVIDGGTLGAQGMVDLVTEALNMHVNAVLNKDLSQQVGGTGIGGFMNTALANRNGELVIPIIVTGNLNRPMIAPDVQKLAQMKLNNLLPTAGNPGALTSGITGILGNKGGQQGNPVQGLLGALGGKQPQQQQQEQVPNSDQGSAQQQQQQQQNPVGDILGGLLNKKKKPK
ncbi:MAG TPA: AsmA-like C-terminal region-containing protein, partial [Terriglobales bacterium]|nr:AsmA-like C-terminal region-containing protein [Terriglobales bacterium]